MLHRRGEVEGVRSLEPVVGSELGGYFRGREAQRLDTQIAAVEEHGFVMLSKGEAPLAIGENENLQESDRGGHGRDFSLIDGPE